MNAIRVLIWIAILIAFARGLFVWDMGGSAQQTYPVAGAICLAGAVVAAALMYMADARRNT